MEKPDINSHKDKKPSLDYLLYFLSSGKMGLAASQSKLCLPIVQRLYKKMLLGIKFSGIKICEDTIVHGHHRYIASLLAKVVLEQYPSQLPLATEIVNWRDVMISEEDWDTEAKIRLLNDKDAEFNKIDIAVLQEITS